MQGSSATESQTLKHTTNNVPYRIHGMCYKMQFYCAHVRAIFFSGGGPAVGAVHTLTGFRQTPSTSPHPMLEEEDERDACAPRGQFPIPDDVNVYAATPRTISTLDSEEKSTIRLPLATSEQMRRAGLIPWFPLGMMLEFDQAELDRAVRRPCKRAANRALASGTFAGPCPPSCGNDHVVEPPTPVGYHRVMTTPETHRVACLAGQPAAFHGQPAGGAVFASGRACAGLDILRVAPHKVAHGTASCFEVAEFEGIPFQSHICIASGKVTVVNGRSNTCTMGAVNSEFALPQRAQFLYVLCTHLWLCVRQRWFYNPNTGVYIAAVDPDSLRVSRDAMVVFLALSLGMAFDEKHMPAEAKAYRNAAVRVMPVGSERTGQRLFDLDVLACQLLNVRTFVVFVSQRLYYWNAARAWHERNRTRIKWVVLPPGAGSVCARACVRRTSCCVRRDQKRRRRTRARWTPCRVLTSWTRTETPTTGSPRPVNPSSGGSRWHLRSVAWTHTSSAACTRHGRLVRASGFRPDREACSTSPIHACWWTRKRCCTFSICT